MIQKNQRINRQDDIKIITWIIVAFLFIAWLCTPPGNKFLQMCFWGNNTKMLIAKIRNEDAKQYIFYRNNAVYLAKMFPNNKNKSISEMNKAIALFPSYGNESELQLLYKERAQLYLFFNDYKNALSDYMRAEHFEFQDYLKLALLYKEAGNYREALSYCNSILNVDATAYSGFACLANVYESAGRPDVAIKVWDLSIDRKPNNPRAYADRAKLKKVLGDEVGYNADMSKAKEYAPTLNENDSLIRDTLHPRILTLNIR